MFEGTLGIGEIKAPWEGWYVSHRRGLNCRLTYCIQLELFSLLSLGWFSLVRFSRSVLLAAF